MSIRLQCKLLSHGPTTDKYYYSTAHKMIRLSLAESSLRSSTNQENISALSCNFDKLSGEKSEKGVDGVKVMGRRRPTPEPRPPTHHGGQSQDNNRPPRIDPETQCHVHPGGMLTIAACTCLALLGLTGIVATDQCQIDPPRVRFADSAHCWSYLHLYSCVCTFHVAVFGPRSRGSLIRKLFMSGAMNNVHPGSAQRRSMVRQPPAIIGNN